MAELTCPFCHDHHPNSTRICPNTSRRMPRPSVKSAAPHLGDPGESGFNGHDPFEQPALSLRMSWGEEMALYQGDSVVIGRDSAVFDGAAKLPDNVSRRHLRIVFEPTGPVVEDLRSTNGTFLNDVLIQPGVPTPIGPGDTLRMGSESGTPYVLVSEAS